MVDFEDLLSRCEAAAAASTEAAGPLAEVIAGLRALVRDERHPGGRSEQNQHLLALLQQTLAAHDLRGGAIAELGGHLNSFMGELPQGFDVTFLSIFPWDDARYRVADITHCPQIPDASFDVVFSKNVLEHVRSIDAAAREIVRILKPGGITMHSVPFSYFYHGAPADYWRVTTAAMEALFHDLEPLHSAFYPAGRRRNNLGSPANAVDQDGGPAFSPDAFGGWRENWFTIFVGRKPADGRSASEPRRVRQLYVDLVKGFTETGLDDEAAIAAALKVAAARIRFDVRGQALVTPEAAPTPPAWALPIDEVGHLWRTRSRKTVRPSPERFSLMAMLDALSGTPPMR